MEKTIEITTNNVDEVLSSDNLIVIDFWAVWCGPCKIYSPTFDEVSNNYEDVIFGKVDCDKEGELASKYGVRSIPTTLFIKNGNIVDKKTGIITKEDLISLVNKNNSSVEQV